MTRLTNSHRMQPREKLIAWGYGLVALITLVFAAAMPEVRAVMLALCVGAAAQLPVWLSAPMTSSGPPSKTLVALESGLVVGSVAV
jgi:hypothetical protein